MLPDPSDRPTLSVEEAAEMLGVGRTAAYAAARGYLRGAVGGIPCLRIGRTIRVPTAALLELLHLEPHHAERPAPDRPAEPQPVTDPRLTPIEGRGST